jgi:hypothetical protein
MVAWSMSSTGVARGWGVGAAVGSTSSATIGGLASVSTAAVLPAAAAVGVGRGWNAIEDTAATLTAATTPCSR